MKVSKFIKTRKEMRLPKLAVYFITSVTFYFSEPVFALDKENVVLNLKIVLRDLSQNVERFDSPNLVLPQKFWSKSLITCVSIISIYHVG